MLASTASASLLRDCFFSDFLPCVVLLLFISPGNHSARKVDGSIGDYRSHAASFGRSLSICFWLIP